MNHGLIGGNLARHILTRIGTPSDPLSGASYHSPSRKLETLLGPDIWRRVRGRTVLDFGCGNGREAVEVARRGAARVIGLDLQEELLAQGRREAESAGVATRCEFVTATEERVDLVISLDGFEHYDDPAGVLALMHRLLRPDGAAEIAFGPPWLHPLGGHLFSVFPWAHVIFSEEALLHWRTSFRDDGATRFSEVRGGLNQMTVGGFIDVVEASPFVVEKLELVPIRRARWLANRFTRELFTSIVRCRLRPQPT